MSDQADGLATKDVEGIVIRKKQNTLYVEIKRQFKHKKYRKFIRRQSTLAVHINDDAQPSVDLGDLVSIVQTKPISKTKRWTFQGKIN